MLDGINWSQFVPDLIVGLFVLAVPTTIAYLKSGRFRDWLGRLANHIRRWLVNYWRLLVGLSMLFAVAYGACVLMDTPWAALLTLGLALATILLSQYLLRPQLNHLGESDGQLLQRIGFDYQDSPTNHGWEISELRDETQPPSLRPLHDGFVGRTLQIKATAEYAMDFYVNPGSQIGNLVDYVAKLGSKAIVYSQVEVQSMDGSQSKNVWLKFLVGTASPQRFGDGASEWILFVVPTRLESGWLLFQVDLSEAVKRTFGNDGWRFMHLMGFRLRGNMSLAYISVFESK